MYPRSSAHSTVGRGGHGPTLPGYVALVMFLGCLSIWVVLGATSILIQLFPKPSGHKTMTRVERWAGLASLPPVAATAAVNGWIARAEDERPAIPIAAIRDSEAFGVVEDEPRDPVGSIVEAIALDPRATYRTVCVRLCDGAYVPVSFATTAEHFEADERRCSASCDSPSRLYFHRNPGEGPEAMIDRSGAPYVAMETAFLFRTRYDARCSCNGQPWEQLAEARHRLYALEEEAPRSGRAAEERRLEIAALRERVAAGRRQIASRPRPPAVYAVADRTFLSDASAALLAALPADETVASSAAVEPGAVLSDPGAGSGRAADPATDAVAGIDRRTSAEDGLSTAPPAAIADPVLGEPKVDRPARKKSVARAKRERTRMASLQRAQPGNNFARRWASRTPADETRRNLMRGSF